MEIKPQPQLPVIFHLITGFGVGGAERLLEAALRDGLPPEALVREVCHFAGNGHAQDDATVLVLRGLD